MYIFMRKTKRLLAIETFALLVAVMIFGDYVYAQESWFHPSLTVRETYDDNIFLDDTDEKSDFITTVSPSIVIEPPLNKHKLTLDYRADLNFFADHDGENNYNHLTNAALELDFNKLRLDLKNRFTYFSDRSGGEDVNRIDRTQDYVSIRSTFDFAKMDLSLGYYYRFEDYRTSDAIGSFGGKSLTYQDLDTDEHTGEIESALKLWPKTSLLFSGDYGAIIHDTGNKSDSTYFDALVGLRGEPTAKLTIEGKIGYRGQDYENVGDDFESVVFNGNLIGNFTSRDVLRLDFARTTYDTIYKENAYYNVTFIGAGFKHGFTDRIFGSINSSYQLNDYPVSTAEGSVTDKREDDLWRAGFGLSYEMPKGIIAEAKYEHIAKDSNFSVFDYNNNLVTLSLTAGF